jgi:hypothetical protein
MHDELYMIIDTIYDSEEAFNINELESIIEINLFDLKIYLDYLIEKNIIKLVDGKYITLIDYDTAIRLIEKGM